MARLSASFVLLAGLVIIAMVLSVTNSEDGKEINSFKILKRVARNAESKSGKTNRKGQGNKKSGKRNRKNKNAKKTGNLIRREQEKGNKKKINKINQGKINKKKHEKMRKQKRNNKKKANKGGKRRSMKAITNKKRTRKNMKARKEGNRIRKERAKAKAKNKKINKKTKKVGDDKKQKRKNKQTCETCHANAADVWKKNNGPVKNFIKQVKTIFNQLRTIGNKFGKNHDFVNEHYNLESVLGENATCRGDRSRGARASRTAEVLKNCKENIRIKCTTIEVNETLLNCNATMFGFKDEVDRCKNLTDAEASCECYNEMVKIDKDDEMVSFCSKEGIKSRDVVRKLLKSCRATFQECKSGQDNTLEHISGCHDGSTYVHPTTTGKPSGTTGGARRNRVYREIMQRKLRANGMN